MPDPAKLKVFLCHSSGDKPIVRELYQRLKAENWIEPWLDEEELYPGQPWQYAIEKALEESHIILVCLTPESVAKIGYVQAEIETALFYAKYMPEGLSNIIPLKLAECEIPRRLSRWQAARFYDERGREMLLKGLRLHAKNFGIVLPEPPVASPPIQKPPVPPVIKAVEPKLAPAPAPSKTEAERLLDEIAAPNTTHKRRMEIGDRLSEIGDPRKGVSVREDGIPDIAWLAVAPGGKLKIEKQTFEVQPFYIAQYQVTFAQYEAFVKATDGYQNREWWQGFPQEYQPQELREQRQKGLNIPRDNMSWYQAVAFGRWLNKRMQGWQLPNPGGGNSPLVVGQNAQVRLPLEWEWQWAAQGGNQQRAYPWGAWQEGYANTNEADLARTTAVGMYPQGAAACGALDMSGNVWEWCQNEYQKPSEVAVDESNAYRVLRGGSFYYDRDDASCAYRLFNFPYKGNFYRGLRVVLCAPMRPSEL
ncbi:MAG: SUMF1/EgtB/PvdO family nonheme iron enzyme [Chloroflexi bacterium]|uniref:SUMF1/EgtB/PvdO family nonheme iron enzyme n=1 Tax=Candidatus Chlorohelix allophototropha TaxID=3003348 RepID=A0A8T7M9W4_9CHLR|nr:SUMF1/EgtB/PvdO family nonheme iron enzyme [Chloroflexota bacterium]WJW68748.1 SUMF1/EgtB/PvdO family nonheme iron enzyme [Chloroflexota bacterium L227-S17]